MFLLHVTALVHTPDTPVCLGKPVRPHQHHASRSSSKPHTFCVWTQESAEMMSAMKLHAGGMGSRWVWLAALIPQIIVVNNRRRASYTGSVHVSLLMLLHFRATRLQVRCSWGNGQARRCWIPPRSG